MSPKQVTDFNFAIGNLATATLAVLDAAKRFEEWWRELEEKETKLKQAEELVKIREKELESKDKQVQDIEKRFKKAEEKKASLIQLEKELKEKEKALSEKEKRMQDTEERMKGYEEAAKKLAENTAKVGTVVKLSVGGKCFEISKSTLLKYKGSYFEAMLTSDSQQSGNPRYFVDRDAKYFRFLINYLREGQVPDFKGTSFDARILCEEFSFYRIPIPPEISAVLHRPESGRLLSAEHKNIMAQWLPNKQFTLIYKASRDGFSAANFHAKCDVPSTLSVIQSEGGWIFGGYTSKSWTPTGGFKMDDLAFIFTLTNPHSIPPTKYTPPKTLSQNSIFCHAAYSIVFGATDIRVNNNNLQDSYTRFPVTFHDTTNKGKGTFTGAEYFTTKDIEVYSVI